jgi:hypothetical protein
MNPMVAGAGVQLGLASELYQSINGILEVLSCMFELGLAGSQDWSKSCLFLWFQSISLCRPINPV